MRLIPITRVALAVLIGIGKSIAADADDALKRRLLAPHAEKLGRVVFTKHFDTYGSHYAYTDAVSDEDI
ncbi:MAG: hypothetical protein WCP45_07015 [Verrucomicrobiota bacterium]